MFLHFTQNSPPFIYLFGFCSVKSGARPLERVWRVYT
nr:MAG TPA: hypothetical protein [Bacteriophage sp.]DAW99269.1 MAG TPA: hypothetical protein [Bacteriophage sp.]